MVHAWACPRMHLKRWTGRAVELSPDAGCMGFLWVNGFSFFHCVASPFHSFVTTISGCGRCWTGRRARMHVHRSLADVEFRFATLAVDQSTPGALARAQNLGIAD